MNKTKSFRGNALRTSVSLALAAGLTTAGYGTAFAQDQDATATEGRVEVTGSRIKRADLEGALPVTVIDRETIELSGEVSVADLLRNTTFNSFGSFRPQSGSSAQSFAGLSLRGLGTGRTLILIDGRRAPIAPNVGSAQDLNAIPLGAVERIEILSDGASAVYGTDAIGGVVNIITRKDFNGVEFRYGQSSPVRTGGDTEEGAVMFGASGDRASVTGGVSWNNRQIIFARDRFWSAGGASVFSNNFLTMNSFFITHPTFGSAVPGGCSDPGFSIVSSGATTRCIYDFTFVSADEADIRNRSIFIRGNYQVNDDWSTFMNVGLSRVQSFGRYAPVPSSPWPGGFPLLIAGTPNHPGTIGGNNPNAADYQAAVGNYPGPGSNIRFIHRFASLGPRDTNTDANVYDLQFGFQGRVGDVDLDFGVRQTDSQYYSLGRNYVVGSIAQQFITSGQYNIYNPTGNAQNILDAMIATINRDARFKMREGYVNANMDLPFEMDGGVVASAFGIEYRDEDYKDIYDTLSSSGQIVGSAGNSSFGGRNASAAFFEVLLPATSDFEVTLAGRYDKYSDFGSAFSPKVAFRWQPREDFTVRGSWGRGFRAPPLDILAQQPSFSAAGTSHTPTCIVFFGNPCGVGGAPGSTQVTTFSIANPNLDAEKSKQWSVGLAWDATDWINFNLDYYKVDIDGRVASIGVNAIVACLEGTSLNCPPGLSTFPVGTALPNVNLGLGVIFGPSGNIIGAQTGFTNLGTISTSGLDFQTRTNFDFGNYGRLQQQMQIGMVQNYKVDSGANVIGDRGLPKYRASLQNRWSLGDFQLVWNINYIHKQPDASATGLRPNGGLPSWTTHDLQFNYFTPWNSRLTLGVRNLLNKDPVVDPAQGRDFNFSLYNGYGRVPYFRYVQTF